MQTNTTTTTPARKLERVRVRTVTRAVQVTEGRLLDFDTADDIIASPAHGGARVGRAHDHLGGDGEEGAWLRMLHAKAHQ